jgi:hypothetical protein
MPNIEVALARAMVVSRSGSDGVEYGRGGHRAPRPRRIDASNSPSSHFLPVSLRR